MRGFGLFIRMAILFCIIMLAFYALFYFNVDLTKVSRIYYFLFVFVVGFLSYLILYQKTTTKERRIVMAICLGMVVIIVLLMKSKTLGDNSLLYIIPMATFGFIGLEGLIAGMPIMQPTDNQPADSQSTNKEK